jgi:hypothetical protein
LSHLDTCFSVWDNFFLFSLIFYSLDFFFQTLKKIVLCDFFGILAFNDFLKTNFVICSTKNMEKHFVLSDKLLHVMSPMTFGRHCVIYFFGTYVMYRQIHTHLCKYTHTCALGTGFKLVPSY